jgi:hypothetical protein
MSNLWIHYKMLTPADVEYDMLPSGPGSRFTQMQVWVGSKKALAGWGGNQVLSIDFRARYVKNIC